MPPTRAPSVELLRALHRTANSFVRPSQRTSCGSYRQYHSSTSRKFAVTSAVFASDRSQPKPSTYPPTTSTSPSGQAPSQSKVNPYAPVSHDRGPESKEDTQTDFGAMDIYANIPTPATSIDACTSDGFHLDNGIKITGYAGVIVAGGEAWSWRPWMALQSQSTTQATSSEISILLDARRGILTIPKQSLGLLAMLHPKPDLLIFGTGSKLWMLAPETKRYLMEELGIRVDVMDTGNASAAYNLLAKERGVEGGAGVGGAFLPIGWKGPETGRKR